MGISDSGLARSRVVGKQEHEAVRQLLPPGSLKGDIKGITVGCLIHSKIVAIGTARAKPSEPSYLRGIFVPEYIAEPGGWIG